LISSQPSPSWATNEWDALVAGEARRQGAIEAAHERADMCESEGGFQLALEWLDRASELSGGLSDACRAQRAHLVGELESGNH
jgi:hypothetical protein